jgi:hypothetical protein
MVEDPTWTTSGAVSGTLRRCSWMYLSIPSLIVPGGSSALRHGGPACIGGTTLLAFVGRECKILFQTHDKINPPRPKNNIIMSLDAVPCLHTGAARWWHPWQSTEFKATRPK